MSVSDLFKNPNCWFSHAQALFYFQDGISLSHGSREMLVLSKPWQGSIVIQALMERHLINMYADCNITKPPLQKTRPYNKDFCSFKN